MSQTKSIEIEDSRLSAVVRDSTSNGVLFKIVHADPRFFSGQAMKIWSAEISPDGARIATAGRDTTVRLWNGMTGSLVMVLSAQEGCGDTSNHAHEGGYMWSASFSPDSQLLITAGNDGCIRLWSVQSGSKLLDVGTFGASQNPPGTVVRFAADGRSVLAHEESEGSKSAQSQSDSGLATTKLTNRQNSDPFRYIQPKTGQRFPLVLDWILLAATFESYNACG